MLRYPHSPWEAGPGQGQEGTHSLAALAGVVVAAGSPRAQAAIVLLQAPVFSHFRFFLFEVS